MSDKYPGGFVTAGAPAGFSVAFDGTGDYLRTPTNAAFALGTSDFTFETWFYPVAAGNDGVIIDNRNPSGGTNGFSVSWASGSVIRVIVGAPNVWDIDQSTAAVSVNSWVHYALTRSGTTFRIFLNGALVYTSGSISGSMGTTAVYATLGASYNASNPVTGYLSNTRLIKGTALYTAAFTPPTQLFPVTNTSLLTCQSPTIIDNSSNAFTITVAGDAKVSNFTPFAGYTGFNPALGAAAGGVWTLDEAAYYQQNRLWPIYDPYFNQTTLMLHGNGTNGAQNNTFLDSSTNNFTITRNGNTTQGSFTPFSQTGWSTYFSGSSGTRLTYPGSASTYVSGTGDFTIEMWINIDSASAGRSRMLFCSDTANALNVRLGPSNTSNINGLSVGRNFNSDNEFCSFTFAFSTWYHVAVVRASAVYYFFINGVQIPTQGSGTSSYSFATATTVAIGDAPSFPNDEIYKGYISNTRVSNVARYTSSFTPSTQPLTAASGTQFLSLQNQRFVDNSANNSTITSVGSSGTPSVQAFSPFVPAYITPTTYSNFFDGNGDYLTVPDNANLELGSGDFTIECWINTTVSNGGYVSAVSKWGTSNQSYMIRAASTDIGAGWSFFYSTNGSNYFTVFGSSINDGGWHHVAVTRSGNVFSTFTDGVLKNSTTDAVTLYNGTSSVTIGAGDAGANPFTGVISNLRIVKGTALYTASFTPPTAPLTAVTNTQLLTCQSSTFIDNSTNNFTITANGNVQPVASPTPFAPKVDQTTLNTAYSTSLIGGSAYFDGSGDYLSVASGSSLNLGTNNYTMDLWWYPTAFNSDGEIFHGTNGTFSFYNAGGGGVVYAYIGTGTGPWDILSGGVIGTAKLNQWNHIAITRSGSAFRTFLNGVPGATATSSASITSNNTFVGARAGGAGVIASCYIANCRILSGTALYTSAFAPPIVPPTPITGTTELLSFTNGAIFDNTAKNVLETVNGAAISTTQSKYGGSSIYLDGNSPYSYLKGNANLAQNIAAFGAGDFTVECWVYLTTTATDSTIIDTRPGTSSGSYYLFYVHSNQIAWYVPASGYLLSTSTTFTANTWTHIAVARSGGTIRSFFNGVLQQSATDSNVYANPGAPYPYIGASYSVASDSFHGYIDDLRITKGVARYTTNFTPPTSQLQDQ